MSSQQAGSSALKLFRRTRIKQISIGTTDTLIKNGKSAAKHSHNWDSLPHSNIETGPQFYSVPQKMYK